MLLLSSNPTSFGTLPTSFKVVQSWLAYLQGWGTLCLSGWTIWGYLRAGELPSDLMQVCVGSSTVALGSGRAEMVIRTL